VQGRGEEAQSAAEAACALRVSRPRRWAEVTAAAAFLSAISDHARSAAPASLLQPGSGSPFSGTGQEQGALVVQ